MSHDVTQTEKLVEQLGQAHRLVAGFYQRILPLFDQVAQETIDANFWYWAPSENSRPCSKHTRPSSAWTWDFIPMFASTHAYRTWNGSRALCNDMTLAFCLYIDDAIKADSPQRLGRKGEPDPLRMELGNAIVEVYLFRCNKDSEHSFDTLWDNIPWPYPTEQWTAADEYPEIEFYVRQVPLAELLSDATVVTRWIKTCLDQVVK
ncbi:hypothetical protein [Aeromonas salmonicida]|uniref:hypothetical protein n=1 Tax=Aeromonas salmonicida TaxID=645 RepID=UPI00072FAA24|nr:hypothetical protein [Aeromonas salmonicida]KTA75565.1 hypothetical protein VO68_15340 [Aeromonas salmonicida]